MDMKNRLKILIITHYFPPLNSIASHRPYSWAKYWSKMGHDVTVLTTKKFDSDNKLELPLEGFSVVEIENRFYSNIRRILKGSENTIQKLDVEKDINNTRGFSIKKMILSFIKSIRENKGIFATARMPDLTDFWFFDVIKKFKYDNYDVIVSTSGPYVVHLIGLRFKKRGLSKFWVADYRDLWTQNHNYPGIFPFTIIEEILEKK